MKFDNNYVMAARRPLMPNNASDNPANSCDIGRELFDACRYGDVSRVRRLVTQQNVNARDAAGRKSTPLHFAAGKKLVV